VNDWPNLTPAEIGADSAPGEPDIEPDGETAALPAGVRNGDVGLDQPDPTAVSPTSDPDPDDVDADFPGQPLTDAEIDALP
jgi:hypothetical protein